MDEVTVTVPLDLVEAYEEAWGEYCRMDEDGAEPGLKYQDVNEAGYGVDATALSLAQRVVRAARAEEGGVDLLPEENISLTVGLSQIRRGDTVMENIAAMCVLALGRITGRFDYTQELD